MTQQTIDDLREELHYARAAITRLDKELDIEEQQLQLLQIKLRARDKIIARLVTRISELEWRLGIDDLTAPPPSFEDLPLGN